MNIESTIEDYGVLPETWDGVPARNLRISITKIDEFGLPTERRGVEVGIPRPSEVPEFAEKAATLVKKTLEVMFQ